MKHSIISFLLIMSASVNSNASVPEETILNFSINKIETSTENKQPTHPKRHRIPSKSLNATISSAGIEVDGLVSSEIIYFEIYTLSGILMESYSNEIDFVQALFLLSGEYEIRIITDEDIYTGIVYIE